MALVAVGLICIAILLVQAPLNRGQGNNVVLVTYKY